jgi:CBS-domain-containing membrane protein
MSEERVHHLWVVDAEQTPLAIITPGDVLTLLVRRANVISEGSE